MSQPKKTRDQQQSKPKKNKPPMATISQMGLDPTAAPMGQLMGEADGISISDHAKLLRNRRYQPVQRQLMARQIGRTFGNHYLQRVIIQMKRDEARERPAPHQPDIRSKSGPAQVFYSTLPNGQAQQTMRIPFTQVIARVPENSDAAAGDREPEPPIHIDEIKAEGEDREDMDRDSTVSANIGYETSITPGGVTLDPDDFGVTVSTRAWRNIDISSSIGTIFNSGVYTVTGDFEYTVRWDVRTPTGPHSQVDIASDTDPDIKACNYQYVSKDITPNMGDLGGRPPRDDYYSADLTARHERFHADERSRFGRDGATAAQAWLNTRTATSADQVRNTLLPQALDEGGRAVNTRMAAPPGKEQRAYGDGAPVYLARARSIKTKGDAGDYGQVSARVTVHPKGGGTYEVVSGDTLWAIAERTYGHGRYWREIHRANPGKARDGGNLIFPGQVFDLPTVNIDQELYLSLAYGTTFVLTRTVTVTSGASHEFFVQAKDIFDDSTDCSGNVDIDVMDPAGTTLKSMTWALPRDATSRTGNIEVAARIAP